MELGGNAPFIVFDDADVRRCAKTKRRLAYCHHWGWHEFAPVRFPMSWISARSHGFGHTLRAHAREAACFRPSFSLDGARVWSSVNAGNCNDCSLSLTRAACPRVASWLLACSWTLRYRVSWCPSFATQVLGTPRISANPATARVLRILPPAREGVVALACCYGRAHVVAGVRMWLRLIWHGMAWLCAPSGQTCVCANRILVQSGPSKNKPPPSPLRFFLLGLLVLASSVPQARAALLKTCC